MKFTLDEVLKEITKNATKNNALTTALREDIKVLASKIKDSLIGTDGMHIVGDQFFVDSYWYRLALSGGEVVIQRKSKDQINACAVRPDGSYVVYDNFEYLCTFENVPFTLISSALETIQFFLEKINDELVRQISNQHDITKKIQRISNALSLDPNLPPNLPALGPVVEPDSRLGGQRGW